MELLLFPVIIFFIAIAALSVLLHFVPIGLWISALAADVNISLFNLVGMRIRRVSPQMIVLPLIKGTKAGLSLSVNQLEAHYLAGGNVDNVVDALIAAHRAQIDLSFEQAAAIDLAGRNVLEAVQMSVNPKVIETPTISAVAKTASSSRSAHVSPSVRISIASSAGQGKRPSSPVSVKASSRPSAPPKSTPTYWRIRITFPVRSSAKVSTRGQLLRSSPSISPMSM